MAIAAVFIAKEPRTRRELEKLVKGKSPAETKQIIRNMETEQEKELLPNKIPVNKKKQNSFLIFISVFLSSEPFFDGKMVPGCPSTSKKKGLHKEPFLICKRLIAI